MHGFSIDEGSLFNNLYATWNTVKNDTIHELGKEKAFDITVFHVNNCIDINSWLFASYSKSDLLNLLVMEFQRVFKEMHWLQFFFLIANYVLIYRNLRFILEMLSKACYIRANNPSADYSKQIEEIECMDRNRIYGWKIVKKNLQGVLGFDEKHIEEIIRPKWDALNSYVHPSAEQMDTIAGEDPNILITDTFNRRLATSCIEAVDEILDFIYAIILCSFPLIKNRLLDYNKLDLWKKRLPYTMNMLETI